MSTRKQAAANRENAKLSTGPRSVAGKEIVSGNRITHGVLSTKLLLADERLEDYQGLLDSLWAELKPVGTLELILTEKIAVTVWRQRRLVRAETNTIALSTTPGKIAEEVSAGMDVNRFSSRRVKADDLEPPDQEQLNWCQRVIAECAAVASLNVSGLKNEAPLLFKQLSEDASGEPIEKFLDHYDDGLQEYVRELVGWCRKELDKAETFPQIQALAAQARDKLSIPWGNLNLFNKYQVSLDNQLFRAIRALREAQEWRLKTLDGEAADVPENGAEAA